jgi:amino acid transporter
MPAERDGPGTHTAVSGLHRGLGRVDVVALTLNTIVGAGIFGLPSALVAAAGPWSVAVLAAAFALIAAVALCAAEVASRFDATGGPVLYAHEALGPLGGFTVGWLLYLTRLATFGAVTVVMLDYAAALWPALSQPLPRALAVTLFVAAIAALNLRGVVLGAGVGNLLVVLKLLPLVALALAGLLLAGWPDQPPAPLPALHELGPAFLLAFFACMGFEQATVIAGELRRPASDLPAGMLAGFALTGLLYAALLLTCQATVPGLAESKRPLAEAAAALFGPWGATAIAIAAVFSCAGNLSTSILVTPRVLFALAEQGELPPVLARVGERSRVPTVAIVLTATAVCALTVSGSFVYLATLAVIARMLMYGSICLALPLLRRRGPAPLAMPGGTVLAALALLACLAVLRTASVAALHTVAVALLAGYALRFGWRRASAPRP